MDEVLIEKQIRALGTWFQNMDLGGVWTAPQHPLGDYPAVKWRHFRSALPLDLSGKSVLEIGCNAGFYSFEMKRRGAAKVLGIDTDPAYLRQAEFARDVFQLDVEFKQMSVYDVASLEQRFDVVLFLGVVYHLRHPLLALDLLRDHVAGDLFIAQSMLRGDENLAVLQPDYPFAEEAIFQLPQFPKMHFIEHFYTGDPTNWWIPNRACFEAMLRSAGFKILDRPEREVFLCEVTTPNRWSA